jgi:hypothetical protein
LPLKAAARYPELALDDPWVAKTALILLATEPFRFRESHVNEIQAKTGKPALLIDGEMTSWYGSRAIAGLEYLREFAHRS